MEEEGLLLLMVEEGMVGGSGGKGIAGGGDGRPTTELLRRLEDIELVRSLGPSMCSVVLPRCNYWHISIPTNHYLGATVPRSDPICDLILQSLPALLLWLREPPRARHRDHSAAMIIYWT